jgi:hypothetical protein
MRMTREDAIEKACAVVARNPHLDGIADDTKVWLVNDIANAVYDAWFNGRDEGYEAGAEAVGAQWRASIS